MPRRLEDQAAYLPSGLSAMGYANLTSMSFSR
jgi:hypothetical protein